VPPELFTIERSGPGRLSTMARPRGGGSLADELRDLAAAGVEVLVSLLTDGEIAELDLAGEGNAADAVGIDFRRLPTPDMHVPELTATLALAGLLLSRLRAGADIVVHCRAGVGRSSTLAAAVLVLGGLAPSDAWDRISAARGLRVPETAAQRDFVDGLASASGE
jgi:protein-tyrosine phosphatase